MKGRLEEGFIFVGILAPLFLFVGVVFGFLAGCSGEGASADRSSGDRGSSSRAVGVDELMLNVDRYRENSLLVEGIVSGVSIESGTLALIDCREFIECGVTTCAKRTLPARWNGAMPRVRDAVRLEGDVRDEDGKLIFVARTLERMDAYPAGEKSGPAQ